MKAIIIGAGSSTRLGEDAKNLPKGLLDINGTTILERQISLLKKHGVDDIFIIAGPHKEKYNLKNVTYIDDVNHPEHDVLFSLMAASKNIVGDVIISYSDMLFDSNILKQVLNFKGQIGITVDLDWEKAYVQRTMHPKSQADNVLMKNNKIIEIKKNIIYKDDDQIMGEFIGLIKLSKKGSQIFVNEFNRLKKSHTGNFHDAPSFKKAYLTDMIRELIDRNVYVSPIIVKGKWCEIDTPQDLEKARKEYGKLL